VTFWRRGEPFHPGGEGIPLYPKKIFGAVVPTLVSASMNTIEDLRKQKGLAGVPEVCRVLGKSRNTVFAWVKAGRLKAYWIGNALKFDRSELADWLEARRVL
jgi:excisionase family DNA binding protein